ncbi:MAG: pyridoxamine 5'-phosphate oxidase family protein, partial [Clostridiaceae bacterium]|nr:pyridoxamine 5'-phosphate oxidase family protein [Clostridiaceae bacterium]
PFGAVAKIDGKLYFSTADTKAVYRELVANPNIQIVACKPSREWIRVAGTAVVDDRETARQAMLDACPVLRTHYKTANDKGFAVFYLTDISVERF